MRVEIGKFKYEQKFKMFKGWKITNCRIDIKNKTIEGIKRYTTIEEFPEMLKEAHKLADEMLEIIRDKKLNFKNEAP